MLCNSGRAIRNLSFIFEIIIKEYIRFSLLCRRRRPHRIFLCPYTIALRRRRPPKLQVCPMKITTGFDTQFGCYDLLANKNFLVIPQLFLCEKVRVKGF